MSSSKSSDKTYEWQFNVLYNEAELQKTRDTELSLKVTRHLERLAAKWGYTKSYYAEKHALPGKNKYDEHFYVIENSVFTFVVITPEFNTNYWAKYKQMAGFDTMLKKDRYGFLFGIVIGSEELPKNMCLNNYVLFSEKDWETDEGENWSKIHQMMDQHFRTRSAYTEGRNSQSQSEVSSPESLSTAHGGSQYIGGVNITAENITIHGDAFTNKTEDARMVMAPSNSTTESSAVTRPHVVDAKQQEASNSRNQSSDDRPLDPSTAPTEHDTESPPAPVNQDNGSTPADQSGVSGTGIRHNSFRCTDNTDVVEDYRTIESLSTTKKDLEMGDITVKDNIPSHIGVQDNNIANDEISAAASNIINSEENTTTMNKTSSEPVTESIAHSIESSLGPSSGSPITHNGDDGVEYNADTNDSTNNSIDASDGIDNTVKTSRGNTSDSELAEASGCTDYVLLMQEDQGSNRLQDKERQELKDSETTVPETTVPETTTLGNQRMRTQLLTVFQNIFQK